MVTVGPGRTMFCNNLVYHILKDKYGFSMDFDLSDIQMVLSSQLCSITSVI